VESVAYQWTMSCPAGTMASPTGPINSATTVAACEPCPAGRACLGHSADNATGLFSGAGSIPWTFECPKGTYAAGKNAADNVVTCVDCPSEGDWICPGAIIVGVERTS
jgi:hypothetical protein